MKKKKKSNRWKFVTYQLTDYRGKTIFFNNHGAISLFGTDTPTAEQLAFAQKVVQKPDYVFRSKPYNRLHIIKRISKKDYLFDIGRGYAGKKTNLYLSDIKIIKVKKVERNALQYDEPHTWRKLKFIYLRSNLPK